MNKKSLYFLKHKLFLDINKSSSDFYGSASYTKFIHSKTKSETTKISSPFSLNKKLNSNLLTNAHRLLLHSKIKSNPKYSKLEIECYTCKKQKKINQNNNFFLTINFENTFKKSRNKENFFKFKELGNTFNKTANRKTITAYPASSSKMEIKKYFINTNRNIKEFVNERRFIKKLRYINKLKSELKEKRENEIEGELKLYDINNISLIKSKNLLEQFETDRNHYNRHLLNDLMINKQILLKIKLKQNILEGQITYLLKKIDDLKGKMNLLREYKNFILSVKNKVSSSINDFNKENKTKNLSRSNSSRNNDKNILDKKNSTKKRYSIFMPLLKKNTFTNKNKDKKLLKRTTFDDNFIKEFKKEAKKDSEKKKVKSDSEMFESPIEFNNKINKMEDNLFSLIYKKNKLSRDVIDMKIQKRNLLKDLKSNSNVEGKIKLYKELINNYKEQNYELKLKLNSLIIDKGNKTFSNLVFIKIREILMTINNNFYKSKKYKNELENVKGLINRRSERQKEPFIFKGIILIEKFIYNLKYDINIFAKNSTEENIVDRIKYKIERDKKYNNEKAYKEEIKRIQKLKKITEKMNKICFISRKVQEKINFNKNKIAKIKK